MDDTRTMRTVLIVIAAAVAAIAILGLMTDKNGGIGSRRTDNLSTYTTGGIGTVVPEVHSDYTYPQGAAAPGSAQLEKFGQALSNEAYVRGMQLGRAVHNAEYADDAYIHRIQLGR